MFQNRILVAIHRSLKQFAFLLFILLQLIGLAYSSENSEHRIVILWASYGNGHKTAAEAMQAEILKKEPKAKVVLKDISDFMPKPVNTLTHIGFDAVVRHSPEVYHLLYEQYMLEAITKTNMAKMSGSKPYSLHTVSKWLVDQNPTVILSSYMMANEMLLRLRQNGSLPEEIQIGWQHTDYAADDYYRKLSKQIDMTFLPSKALEEKWNEPTQYLGIGKSDTSAVPSSKFITTGFPINPKFYETWDVARKNKFLQLKGLSSNQKTFVIVSGGNALGDFPAMVKSFANAFSEPIQVVAICAKSENCYKKLVQLQQNLPQHVTLKLEKSIPNDDIVGYFKSSQGIVTKAGGGTATEVRATAILNQLETKAIFLDINGGQERANIQFFEKIGLGQGTKNFDQVGNKMKRLLEQGTPSKEDLLKLRADYDLSVQPHKIAEWALEKSTQYQKISPPPKLKLSPQSFLASCMDGFKSAFNILTE